MDLYVNKKILKYQINSNYQEDKKRREGATKNNQIEPQFHMNLHMWFNKISKVSWLQNPLGLIIGPYKLLTECHLVVPTLKTSNAILVWVASF